MAKELETKRKYKLSKAKFEAETLARAEAHAVESLEKKRESKIREVREVKKEAEELAKAESERSARIKLARKAAKEADLAKLTRLQKELEIIQADRPDQTLVDMSLDDKPLGRLMLNHNKAYDFNLTTEKPEEKPKGELLVDLKIDGLKGPIPKIVSVPKTKRQVWVDGEDEIETFKMDVDKMKDCLDLSKYEGDDKEEEVEAA